MYIIFGGTMKFFKTKIKSPAPETPLYKAMASAYEVHLEDRSILISSVPELNKTIDMLLDEVELLASARVQGLYASYMMFRKIRGDA